MEAILKKVEAREYQDRLPLHPIKMLFTKTSESDEFYTYETTIEKQFDLSKEEWGAEKKS